MIEVAQEKIVMNGITIWQPDKGLTYNFETTYTEDSTRIQSGTGYFTPLFTVEQLGYTATNIPASKVKEILLVITKGNPFSLRYYSLYYGTWRTDTFYVGQGQSSIGELIEDNEYCESFSFNMTGVNPI